MTWLLLLFLFQPPAAEPERISRGRVIFVQSCAVGYCHGVGGSGARGPRLYMRDLQRDQVARVIRDGVANTAMAGWKDRLSGEDLEAVIDYVMALGPMGRPDPVVEMPPGTGPAQLPGYSGPPETKAGYQLFFDSTREPRCATCHAAAGRGIAVGPDLSSVRIESAAALQARLQSSRPNRVQRARLRNGDSFPALEVERGAVYTRLYDLSSPLPVLRTLETSQIASMDDQTDWNHQVALRPYSPSDLQAIALYLQWLSKP